MAIKKIEFKSTDIRRGLVLHMDPDTLLEHGATYTCSDDRRVKGHHFFLCLSVFRDASTWLPLYSKDGDKRQKLAEEGRRGHDKWTKGVIYWHPEQTWTVCVLGALAASREAIDLSSAAAKNSLDLVKIPKF